MTGWAHEAQEVSNLHKEVETSEEDQSKGRAKKILNLQTKWLNHKMLSLKKTSKGGQMEHKTQKEEKLITKTWRKIMVVVSLCFIKIEEKLGVEAPPPE